MSRQPRRHFTTEFKEQAVARLSEPGATQTGVALDRPCCANRTTG